MQQIELLTAEELAQRLRLSPATIRLWSRQGIIPRMKLSGTVIRFDVAEVIEALRSHSREWEVAPA